MFHSGIDLRMGVMFLLALVMSISFHEFSHAWSAYELGDATAKRAGRVTLNPVRHFDPLGFLMIIYLALGGIGLGWGRPVPVNPNNLRGNRRVSMGLTAVAGPFSNLVLAALASIPLRLGLSSPDLLRTFFLILVVTNVGLAVFNLIPIPPLDGFGVLQGLLGTFRTRWAYEWGHRLDQLAPYGSFLLLAVLAIGWFGGPSILGAVIAPLGNGLLRLLGLSPVFGG